MSNIVDSLTKRFSTLRQDQRNPNAVVVKGNCYTKVAIKELGEIVSLFNKDTQFSNAEIEVRKAAQNDYFTLSAHTTPEAIRTFLKLS